MSFAAVILSTGRCGTQWLAKALAEVYSDRLEVAHEPLDGRYEARQVLAEAVAPTRPSTYPPIVAEHFDNIERRIGTMAYIECGHPAWSSVPFFADRFPGRVRIIHLVRHPVPTCLSWLTNCAFTEPFAPHVPRKILLTPFDEGIRFREYQSNWEELTPYEKCLYYWSEVNAFALDMESRLDVPWLQLRFEDLFSENGIASLLEFLGLPCDLRIVAQRNDVVDSHRFSLAGLGDWRTIENHPRAMTMAEVLGYDLDTLVEQDLESRYSVRSFLG